MRRIMLLSFLGLAACVEGRDAPGLPSQAVATYGDRLYLSDPAQADSAGWCNELITLPQNIGTSTVPPPEAPGVGDGQGLIPYDCHVELSPLQAERRLRVDSVEVTNNLYQLCVDSEACEGPNPYDSDASGVCQNSDRFEACPVVDIGLRQAVSFCTWIGRRLPSSFEHLIMRQAGLPDSQAPETIPIYPTGNDNPATCDQGVLGAPGCGATKPRPVLGPGETAVGGGSQDVVTAADGEPIFDLIGNMSEWSSDRFAVNRGNAEGCPWFCIAALPGMDRCTNLQTSTASAAVAPVCPQGQACVYGYYKPAENLNFDRYPVCITAPSGRFSGAVGATHGGAWSDAENIPAIAGMFSRRIDPSPEEVAGNARGARTGFRCVGDRESGTDDGNGNITIPEFDDRFELRVENP